jgi:predicted flap endonuclease-1-like 5' DNA nuclease
MNYLIIEILGCLIVAAIIGVVLGWFLRGGCKKKLEANSLDWQEKLRIDNLDAKNNISVMEEKFRQQLQNKDNLYKIKLNQLNANQNSQESDALYNEIKQLQKRLKVFEAEQLKNEEEWSLVLEDVEVGLKNKLLGNEKNNNRLKQENIFLKNELDRSVSELNTSEQESKRKEQSLHLLSKKLIRLERELEANTQNWKKKLQERELGWVDKVALLDESSLLRKKALDDCEKKLKEKQIHTQVQSNKVKREKGDSVRDNLKVLRGVGTLLEKELNKLGIYTLMQIASWSERQVLQFDQALSLKGKIKKERWVEQAKKLIALP